MKFTEIGKSKRHAKFSDVKQGQIFFMFGNVYVATEEVVSNYEDINVNAVCLSGGSVGMTMWVEDDEEVAILAIEPEIVYTADDVVAWI
jgi:hypothetical protein